MKQLSLFDAIPTRHEQVVSQDEQVIFLKQWSKERGYPRLSFPVYLDAEFKRFNLVTVEGQEQWATFLKGGEGDFILDGRFIRAWLATGAYDIQNRRKGQP